MEGKRETITTVVSKIIDLFFLLLSLSFSLPFSSSFSRLRNIREVCPLRNCITCSTRLLSLTIYWGIPIQLATNRASPSTRSWGSKKRQRGREGNEGGSDQWAFSTLISISEREVQENFTRRTITFSSKLFERRFVGNLQIWFFLLFAPTLDNFRLNLQSSGPSVIQTVSHLQ